MARIALWLSRHIPDLADKMADGLRKSALASRGMSKLEEAAAQQPSVAERLHLVGGPATYIALDEEMCAHFGVTPDPNQFYRNWLAIFGWRIAMGRSWGEIRSEFQEIVGDYPAELQSLQQPYSAILDWLERYSKRDAKK